MRPKTLFISIVFVIFSSTVVFADSPLKWASGITLTPQSPKVGDQVSFKVSVKSAKDVSSFRVVGVLDKKQVFNRTYSIKAGKGRTIRHRWKATEGAHTLTFRIIPTDGPTKKTAPKSPMATNAKDPLLVVKKFSVTGPPAQVSTTLNPQQAHQAEIQQPVCENRPLPDLVARSLSVSGTGQQGTEHTIAVRLYNQGQCDSGPFSIRLEVYIQVPAENIYQTKEIGKKAIHSLAPCRFSTCPESSKTVYFNYTLLNKNFAHYDFTVEVDPGRYVEEFNEKNNKLERTGTIKVENYD